MTFDSGYQDNLINAAPILKKGNITATLFIATSSGVCVIDEGSLEYEIYYVFVSLDDVGFL